MKLTAEIQAQVAELLQKLNADAEKDTVEELSALISPIIRSKNKYDSLKLLEGGIPLSAFKKNQKSRASEVEVLKRHREQKRKKHSQWRRKKYLLGLEAQGVDLAEREKNLDPERWLPKRMRKAYRKKNKKKLGGGQGVVDDKMEARLDVKAKIEKKVKASSSKKYGKKKVKGRRR